jgi:hypothetical protein
LALPFFIITKLHQKFIRVQKHEETTRHRFTETQLKQAKDFLIHSQLPNLGWGYARTG